MSGARAPRADTDCGCRRTDSYQEPSTTCVPVPYSSSCDSGTPGPWSEIGEVSTAGSYPVDSEFNIDLVWVTEPTATQRSAFEGAVDRWESILAEGVPDWPTPDVEADRCVDGQPEVVAANG